MPKNEIANIRRIGDGGFSDIFVGLHRTAGKVVLKRLRAHGQKEQELRRIRREAETWLNLNHENILPFLGIFKTRRHMYLVSPYVENGALSHYICENPEVDRLRLLRETAAALVYLRQHDIIHGDIKASNILVSDRIHVLLCDFGLARHALCATSEGLRGVGTIRWQSPELWEPNARKTFQSDVWAFGMTISEVMTGRIPFHDYPADGGVILAVSLGKRPPVPPSPSPDEIPVWGVAVDCWEIDPNRRPSIEIAHARLTA